VCIHVVRCNAAAPQRTKRSRERLGSYKLRFLLGMLRRLPFDLPLGGKHCAAPRRHTLAIFRKRGFGFASRCR